MKYYIILFLFSISCNNKQITFQQYLNYWSPMGDPHINVSNIIKHINFEIIYFQLYLKCIRRMSYINPKTLLY